MSRVWDVEIVCDALEYLRSFPKTWLPMMFDGDMPRPASNSELKRWLKNGAVQVNGKRPKLGDKISLPVEQLIFFPNSKKRRTTMLDYGSAY